jgi:hypothetical protein
MYAPARTTAGVIAGLLIATVAAGGTQVVLASTGATIHGCEARATGALRIAKHCTRHEKSISWNQRGPAGPRGLAGKPGAPGNPGTPGLPTLPTAHVESTETDLSIAADQATPVAVISVTIPSDATGDYLVTADAVINTTIDADTGSCQLGGGGLFSSQAFKLVPNSASTVAMTQAATVISTDRTITLYCLGSVAMDVPSADISAIPLSSVDIQTPPQN